MRHYFLLFIRRNRITESKLRTETNVLFAFVFFYCSFYFYKLCKFHNSTLSIQHLYFEECTFGKNTIRYRALNLVLINIPPGHGNFPLWELEAWILLWNLEKVTIWRKCRDQLCSRSPWSYSTHSPVGVPRNDVSIKTRRDEEPRVGVVLDVLHPACVAMQRAHFGVELP